MGEALVVEAEEMVKALSLVETPPDLLILDLTNKIGWGGNKTYDALDSFKFPPIPTIFISGYSEEEFDLNHYENKPVTFLHKPINENLMISSIYNLIHNKKEEL